MWCARISVGVGRRWLSFVPELAAASKQGERPPTEWRRGLLGLLLWPMLGVFQLDTRSPSYRWLSVSRLFLSLLLTISLNELALFQQFRLGTFYHHTFRLSISLWTQQEARQMHHRIILYLLIISKYNRKQRFNFDLKSPECRHWHMVSSHP